MKVSESELMKEGKRNERGQREEEKDEGKNYN